MGRKFITYNGVIVGNGGLTLLSTETDTPTPPSFTNTKSIALDGVDDFVDMGNASSLNFNHYDAYTLSVWIKREEINSASIMIEKMMTSGSLTGYQFAFLSDNTIRIYHRRQNQTYNRIYRVTNNTYTDTTNWYHVVATYDGSRSNSGLKIYVNGSIAPSTGFNSMNAGAWTNTADFKIGRLTLGKIDEVAVFNSELSASDVTNIYDNGVPNDISSLSPLSWWRCGDGDTSPTLTDNGSGGNDGTMTNFSTFSTDVPKFNTKSIALDGVDDSVNIGTTSLGITTALSVSVWVKTTRATGTFAQIIGEYRWGVTTQRNWILYLSNTANRIGFLNYNDDGQRPINTVVDVSDANIDDGNWHHVLVTWDNTTNTNSFKIFFDGDIVKQVTPSLTGIRSVSSVPTYIGNGQDANRVFQGSIDEVAVWNSDQSANASAIYNSGVPNDISSLSPLSWWRCGDGDTSPTLTDNGSGGNDGTMTNFTTFSTDVPT